MKKLVVLSALCGIVAAASTASANNLAYMANPTAKDHQVPVKVSESTAVFSGEKEYKVTYATTPKSLNAMKPAAGPKSGDAKYDHVLGH